MDKISDSESSSDDEPLQVESKIEKPKRTYNRKPMTEEQKNAFKERMAKARSSKRKKFSDNDPLKLYIENKPKPVVEQPKPVEPKPVEPKPVEATDYKDQLLVRMMEKLLEQPVKKTTKPRAKKATEPKKTTARTKQKAEQIDEPVKPTTSKVPSMMFV